MTIKANLGRQTRIPDSTKNKIDTEMRELRKLHCTHVYKYHCEITMEQKFCNAAMTKKKKKMVDLMKSLRQII